MDCTCAQKGYPYLGKVVKEQSLVLGIYCHLFLECLVPEQSHVRRQHHQLASGVLKLQFQVKHSNMLSFMAGPVASTIDS